MRIRRRSRPRRASSKHGNRWYYGESSAPRTQGELQLDFGFAPLDDVGPTHVGIAPTPSS
ncbi:hypothetical protein ACIBO6_02310 [Streptomyces luteogriseus]|uniref:hypothetical protein n=1 Tax=Streptomyces luteogriseus TaxID=68233 RepID=UPI0037A20CC7